VQAVPGREINRHLQFLFEEQLHPDQVEGVEPAVRIIIDEDVEIAGVAGIVACRRAKQIQRRCAQRALAFRRSWAIATDLFMP